MWVLRGFIASVFCSEGTDNISGVKSGDSADVGVHARLKCPSHSKPEVSLLNL